MDFWVAHQCSSSGKCGAHCMRAELFGQLEKTHKGRLDSLSPGHIGANLGSFSCEIG